MMCSKCKFEMKDVISRPKEKLLVLLSHYHCRRIHSRSVRRSTSRIPIRQNISTPPSTSQKKKVSDNFESVPRRSSRIPIRQSQVRQNISTPPSTSQKKKVSDSSENYLVHHLQEFFEPHLTKQDNLLSSIKTQ